MARPQKKGFDYFPLDVELFSDRKIKILRARFGADGLSVYLYLLCEIYKSGFFVKLDKDFEFIIADDLNMSVEKIQQIIAFLSERSLLDSTLLRSDTVLTSAGIQRRWQEMIKGRASKTLPEVESRYWLLSEAETEESLRALFGYSEKNPDNSKKNSDNFEKNDTKKSKVNKSKLNQIANESEEEKKDKSFSSLQQPQLNGEPPSPGEVLAYFISKKCINAFHESRVFMAYNAKRSWDCLPDWKLAADLWLARELEFPKGG